MSIPLILDIVFVLILLASVAIGAGRGAIRAISGLAATLVGIVGALKLRAAAAPLVAKIITPFVRASVERAAEANGLGSILDSQVTHDLLQTVSQLMEALGLGGELGAAIAQEAQAVGARVVDAITEGLVAQIAPAIALLVLFLIIKTVVQLALRLIPWDKIPVIGTLNKTAGAALGLVSGLILVCLLCWGLLHLAPESGDGPLTRQQVQSSAVGSAIWEILGSGG